MLRREILDRKANHFLFIRWPVRVQHTYHWLSGLFYKQKPARDTKADYMCDRRRTRTSALRAAKTVLFGTNDVQTIVSFHREVKQFFLSLLSHATPLANQYGKGRTVTISLLLATLLLAPHHRNKLSFVVI